MRDDLEILIATMNQTSLDFLLPIFPHQHFSEFHILILNQTTEGKDLESNYPKVRVVNSYERGLSKSRNLAIKHAQRKIALLADDDVVYTPDFEKAITDAFKKNTEASIITFNHQRIGSKTPHKDYVNEFEHTLKSVWKVSSIEIAFRVEDIKNRAIFFDENFGLGASFESAEEFLFLRQAIKSNLKVMFCPKVIVSHPLLSSGVMEGSDDLVYARSALFYKTKGILGYLWLLKYMFFLLRKGNIQVSQLFTKLNVGLTGMKKYKQITISDKTKI